jgi:hypothetical protein
MKSSIIFYLDRSDTVQVIDSSSLSYTDGLSPLMLITVAVINAGYDGVVVDEQLMANGRIFQALNTNSATPEGRILAALCKVDPAKLPTPKAVLEDIRRAYRNGQG